MKLPFSNFKSFLRWLDDNILLIFASFLIAFIPLMPKIPLWSPIEQYIVRVRTEDFLILAASIIWGVQVIRKKVKWMSPMFWFVLAYAIIGAISTLVAIFVTKTIPQEPLHMRKTLFHYFRYLEYFSLFFILYSAVKKRADVVLALGIMVFTIISIGVYGYGQKFFYWPVYSTMNREFSKGKPHYLTQFARVQSTFGGHYDMAAFLVVSLPLILAISYRLEGLKWKVPIYTAFWLGTWLIILSASRAPFAAYVAGVGIVLLFSAVFKPQSNLKQKLLFFFMQSLIIGSIMSVFVYYFGADMVERLNNIVRNNEKLTQVVNTLDSGRKMIISDGLLAYVPTREQVYAALPKSEKPPENGVATTDIETQLEEAEMLGGKSNIPPTPFEPEPTAPPVARPLPGDVKGEIPEPIKVATIDAQGNRIEITEWKMRVYSECALKSELSLCIRQETLWPRAVEGFFRNPVTGSGYATLTRENDQHFTEADSTDNNFLRTLGETGVFGFLTFYACVVLVIVSAAKNMNSTDKLKSGLSIGLLAGSIGLMLNALYIDVFAASKVAQTYWALAGLFFGYVYLKQDDAAAGTPTVVGASTSSFASALRGSEPKSSKKRK